MTTVHISIHDAKNAEGEDVLEIEGRLVPAEALDMPPTPAVIIGSYLAGNMELVSKAALAWAKAMTAQAQAEEPAIATPKLILPDDGIVGAPV